MLSCEGMVFTCPQFDSPSLFGRDIQTFNTFVQSWYGSSVESQDRSDRPWKIIYLSDYLPVGNVDQMRVFDEFVDDLAAYLKTDTEKLSIAKAWEQSPPVEERDVTKYMGNASGHRNSLRYLLTPIADPAIWFLP